MSAVEISSAAYFDERYRRNPDPWNFTGSAYEKVRFDTLLRALAHRRYRHALEPGCSIGTLTERLATVCDAVSAFDHSQVAVELAAIRCKHLPHVSIRCAPLSPSWGFANYDLVVLSEVGYYFSEPAWKEIVGTLASQLQAGAEVLACHWLGTSEEHQQSGDGVHATLRAELLFDLQHEEHHGLYRVERFQRRPAASATA